MSNTSHVHTAIPTMVHRYFTQAKGVNKEQHLLAFEREHLSESAGLLSDQLVHKEVTRLQEARKDIDELTKKLTVAQVWFE